VSFCGACRLRKRTSDNESFEVRRLDTERIHNPTEPFFFMGRVGDSGRAGEALNDAGLDGPERSEGSYDCPHILDSLSSLRPKGGSRT